MGGRIQVEHMASLSSRRTSPQKTMPQGLQGVPTVAVTTYGTAGKTAVVYQVVAFNTTASPVTLLVQDQATSTTIGKALVPTISIGGNAGVIIPYPEGVLMTNGVSWQAGGAGMTGEIFGFEHA